MRSHLSSSPPMRPPSKARTRTSWGSKKRRKQQRRCPGWRVRRACLFDPTQAPRPFPKSPVAELVPARVCLHHRPRLQFVQVPAVICLRTLNRSCCSVWRRSRRKRRKRRIRTAPTTRTPVARRTSPDLPAQRRRRRRRRRTTRLCRGQTKESWRPRSPSLAQARRAVTRLVWPSSQRCRSRYPAQPDASSRALRPLLQPQQQPQPPRATTPAVAKPRATTRRGPPRTRTRARAPATAATATAAATARATAPAPPPRLPATAVKPTV
mmetsp:Transcript_31721/g.67397  ORF Transcript_31721/g.67397 Transcript_31721/m.67397 type:complete len:267 (+) Transcript_31721:597-1397(+)